MNDKALSLAYSQAQGTGYKGTQEDFYNLLSSNEEAVNLAYRQASDTGYKGEIGAFSDLLGLKKKVQPEVSEPPSVQKDSTEFSMLADQEPTDSDSQPTPSEQFVGTSTASPEIAQEQFSKRDQQAKDYEDFFLEREKSQADRFGVLNVVENSFKSAMSNYEKSYKDTQELLYDGDREGSLIEDTDAIRRDNTLRRQASLDQMGVSVENQQKSFSELIFSEGETKDGLSMLFADGLTAVMDAPRTLAPMLTGPLGYAFIGVTSAADEYSGLRYDHTLTETERFNKAITSGMIEGVSNSIMGKAAIGLGAVAKTLKSKIGIEAAEAAVSGFRGLVRSTIGEGAEEGLVDIANQVKDMAFDVAYGREDHTFYEAWEDLNLYQSLDAATLGATAGGAMHASVRSLPSFKKAGHTSTIKERVEIDKEIKDLSDSYFKEVDPDIREAKKQKLNKALRAYDVLMEHEGALNDLVPAEKVQQLTAVNQRVANIMEALESGKDPAGITLSEEQIAAKKADLKQLTSIKQDIEQSAIKDYAEENKGQIPLFVEDQNGDQVEVKPVVVEDSEQQQDLEEATEPLEGQEELTQFDEAQPTADEEVDDLSQMESDFSEIDFNEATAEGLQSAGFSSEMSSVVGRVKEGVDKIGGLNEASLVGHKTENSLRKTVAESNKEGGKAVPLQRGEFTFGFVLRKSDGSRSIHLLDTNNAEFQERARENNVEAPSMVDLVTEEVVTHYLLEDLFGSEGTRRSEAYNELKSIASKKNKISELISEVESEYGLDDAKQLEEEVIAAFFVDYVKNPSKYKSAWKQIADFFNNLFKGSRVITTESELMDVARNVSNIMSGKSVKIDIKPTEKKSEGVVKSKKESSYLKNTEIFYHFDRQSGIEMADWTVGKPSGYKGAANKVKVNDFHHFRNWYNKTTSNGEFPGIVSNMYFIKDGKKHTVNPPKPKLGADGSKIKMERIASFGEVRREREIRDRDQELELRVQYSDLIKEVGDLWYNSPLSMHTNRDDFTPEGDSEKLDFEGQMIAKKNIQAALDSEVTSEQLKEMKGRFSVVSKNDYPDLFNMSGLVRFKEAGSGEAIADGEIRFSKAKKPLNQPKKAKADRMAHFTSGDQNRVGDYREIKGKKGNFAGFDTSDFSSWPNSLSGILAISNIRIDGNEVITAHLTAQDANKLLSSLQTRAIETAIAKGRTKAGSTGRIFMGFSHLNKEAIAGNPHIKSLVAEKYKAHLSDMIEDFVGTRRTPDTQETARRNVEQEIVEEFNILLNEVKLSSSKLPKGYEYTDNIHRLQGSEIIKASGTEESVKTKKWGLRSLSQVNDILDSFIKEEDGQGFSDASKNFINKLALKIDPTTDVKVSHRAFRYAKNEKLIDPHLDDKTAGTLIAYRVIPYKILSNDGKNIKISLGLEVKDVEGGAGFKGALVSAKTDFPHPMKFLEELYFLNDIIEGYDKSKSTAQSEASKGGIALHGSIRFSKASGRASKKIAVAAGKKGVSTDQVLQIMSKTSGAERTILENMMEAFEGQKYIPVEDFDAYFDAAMLKPLKPEQTHAFYGLNNIIEDITSLNINAEMIPFAGRPELYGEPTAQREGHSTQPSHAHIRVFVNSVDGENLYVSEIQSDAFQKSAKKLTNVDIEEEVAQLFGSTTDNEAFIEDMGRNPDKYISEVDDLKTDDKGNTSDNYNYWRNLKRDLLNFGGFNPDNRAGYTVNKMIEAVLSKNPKFSVDGLNLIIKHYAVAMMGAPTDVTTFEAKKIFEDRWFGEIDSDLFEEGMGDIIADTTEDLMEMYSTLKGSMANPNVQEQPLSRLEEYYKVKESLKPKPEAEKKDLPVRKHWERQLIRYGIQRAQDMDHATTRFPTGETANSIQGWDTNWNVDETLDDEAEEVLKPLLARYNNLPKTIKSMGLESEVVEDMYGNSWHQIKTPPKDARVIMFSRATAKNNLGDIGGATWEQRSQSKTDDLKDLWLVRLQDKYRRVFKLQEDVAKQTQGQIKESEDFKNAEARLYGMAAEDLEKLDVKTKDILREMKEKKVSVEQLDEYLYALHAKERNAVIRERTEGANDMGSGKTDDWADGILNDMSSERREQLDAVTAIAREIQQDTRDSMVELGLESQETIDAFENMFESYIPLQGLAKDEDSIEFSPYPSGKTGFSVSGKTTKRAKGRVTESSNILAQIVSQNAAIRIKGRTNEALNSLYKLVESNPNDEVWKVLDKETDKYNDSDPNIASVRVKGVQKAVWFKDASYAQSLRDMNLTNTSRFIKFLGSLNSWLRAAFTSRNPEFILSNFSRDIQAAIFNASAESEIEGGFLNGTGAMRRIFKMVGPSLKALVREEVGLEADPLIKKYYEEFKSDGGKTGWAYQKSLEDIASELEIDDSGKTAAQKILGTAKGALDFVEGMNDAFENSIRLSSYIAAREGGVSRAKSAEFAKNITVNFNKQGEWGATLNAVFLFFNASIQGTARVARSLGTLKPAARPDGSSRAWHERATNAQKVAAGLVLFNGMLTLLAQAASDEDEDGILFYNKIPDYVKERNLIIMRPDGKNYWKIPMPYGYNIFANIGTAAVETAAGHRSPLEATAFLAGATINAFSPVSFGQSEDLFKKAAKTAIPTALKPLVDVAVNETYFGGPVKAEQYPFGTPKPNSSMSFRSPEEVKQFFSWMNEATGGSDQVPGVLDINPDGYWYILEYYLGGIGKFAERSVETTRKLASDTEETPVNLDFNDVPMMRIIYGEPSKYYDFQKFKDRQVEIKQLAKEWKTDRKLNDPERYKGLSSLDAILKAYEKRLKAIRAKKRVVRKIADYSERVSKTQLLMEEERKMVMKFNKIYDEKRGK